MKPILDVGCGRNPAMMDGTIGIDIVKSTLTDVVADARHIPFKDNIFSEVHFNAVLEHMKNWNDALTEGLRLSKKVVVTVPHYSSGQAYDPEHQVYFNRRAFRNYYHMMEFHWSGRGSKRRIHTKIINHLINWLANKNLDFAEKWCYLVGGFEEIYAEITGIH
ncbi:MAG: methyltransferase domain-containing protein [Candidatus Altiarchaeota archaeon]